MDWDAYFTKIPANPTESPPKSISVGPQTPNRRQTLINKLKERRNSNFAPRSISELQNIPDNPLCSVKSFQDISLRPELRRSLVSLDYVRPSKVQGSALPLLLSPTSPNMIAQSQSGTGKTATFVMAMLNRVELERKCVQCLCVTPTYELAVQVGQTIERLGQHMTDLKVFYAIKDSYFPRDSSVVDHVVVGTPGKLLHLISTVGVLELTNLKIFVLDEADIIIEQGESTKALDINNFVPATCQMLLFSATYSDSVLSLGKRIAPNAELIRLDNSDLSLNNIEQFYLWCANDEEKKDAIDCIYQNMGIDKAIVFCNTITQSNLLFNFFVGEGFKVVVINSSLDVKERTAELTKFKNEAHVLISTNVTARGLDISEVKIVINFNIPVRVDGSPDYETYLHRIGRSGRFGDLGFSFTFLSDQREYELIQKLEQYFDRPIRELKAGDSNAIVKMSTKLIWD